MIEVLKVLYLGLIEGLTEFIPVSSTGHLILSEHLVQLEMEHSESFAVFIQLGAILAVVVLFWHRFMAVFNFQSGTKELSGVRAIQLYFIACLPAFIFGALFHSTIKQHLFGPVTVAWALIVGGLLFFLVEFLVKRSSKQSIEELNQLSSKHALIIGVFQCLALWPGMSRSGSTIIGGLIAGLNRKLAAEFSFIIAVPVMVAAVGYDLYKDGVALTVEELKLFALGFFISFITAMLAIRFFLHLLNRWTLVPFGWYRIGLGILVLLLVE